MNQGKLEVVKQEMARVNIDILGIIKLKWTAMGNLTQMTIISTTVGKNPLEEMEQPSQSTKESEMQYMEHYTIVNWYHFSFKFYFYLSYYNTN